MSSGLVTINRSRSFCKPSAVKSTSCQAAPHWKVYERTRTLVLVFLRAWHSSPNVAKVGGLQSQDAHRNLNNQTYDPAKRGRQG